MSNLKEALEQLTGEMVPVAIVGGTVKAVRPAENECDVQLDNDDAELLDVAVLNGVYPAVGSPVLVGLVEGRLTDAFLLAVEEVEHFSLVTERESLKKWSQDLLAAVQRLTVTTPAGESKTPTNAAEFTQLKNRLDNLFLD